MRCKVCNQRFGAHSDGMCRQCREVYPYAMVIGWGVIAAMLIAVVASA